MQSATSFSLPSPSLPPTYHISTYLGSQIQEKRGENHWSGDSMYQIKMILLMASEYKEKTDNCPLMVLWLTLQNRGGGGAEINVEINWK